MGKDELNQRISNPFNNLKSLEGFEIICEALVYKIYDIYGRNTLLSMLYQIGKGPGEIIATRIKKKYKKDSKALEILNKEQEEIDLYKKYNKWYGSAFFIMQKK